MTSKKILSFLLYFIFLNTFYCKAQDQHPAFKLIFSLVGTDTYISKDKFLNYYNNSKKNLLKSPYFDSQKNYAPTNYEIRKFNFTKLNYQNEIDDIINKITFETIYKKDTISDIYIKWNYRSKIFEDDNFGYVCDMDVSLNKIFSNKNSYTRKTINQASKIDSVEINYKYTYPVKIDSLQIDFSNLISKKISSNIYIEKFSINGFIFDIKNTETEDFIFLKAFDSKNNELYCRLYNQNKMPTTNFINEFAEYYSGLIIKLQKYENPDVETIKEFENELDNLKFQSYLFSIPSKTKKIIVYLSKQRFEKTGTKVISN